MNPLAPRQPQPTHDPRVSSPRSPAIAAAQQRIARRSAARPGLVPQTAKKPDDNAESTESTDTPNVFEDLRQIRELLKVQHEAIVALSELVKETRAATSEEIGTLRDLAMGLIAGISGSGRTDAPADTPTDTSSSESE